jgi:hypothetical protein
MITQSMTMRIPCTRIVLEGWVIQDDSRVIRTLDELQESYQSLDLIAPEQFEELIREEPQELKEEEKS